MHYSLGFYPEYDLNSLAYKSNKANKWKNFNFVLKYLLYRNYKSYLKKQKTYYK